MANSNQHFLKQLADATTVAEYVAAGRQCSQLQSEQPSPHSLEILSAAAVRGLDLYLSSSKRTNRQQDQLAQKTKNSSSSNNGSKGNGSASGGSGSRVKSGNSSSSALPTQQSGLQFNPLLLGQEDVLPTVTLIFTACIVRESEMTKALKLHAWTFTMATSGWCSKGAVDAPCNQMKVSNLMLPAGGLCTIDCVPTAAVCRQRTRVPVLV